MNVQLLAPILAFSMLFQTASPLALVETAEIQPQTSQSLTAESQSMGGDSSVAEIASLSLAEQLALSQVMPLSGDPVILGTEATPFLLSNVGQLEELATYVNDEDENFNKAHYKLTQDVSLSSVENWTSIGKTGTKSFQGTFDGAGHVISNLTQSTSSEDRQGLFGYTKDATIRNLGVEQCNVIGSSSVGGLVGLADCTTIENCYATGAVTGTDFVGGLMGQATGTSTIKNCYATGAVTGTDYVGGLMGVAQGVAQNVTISNCYATGAVTGTGKSVGGVVGYGENVTIQNSVALNPSVTGTTNVNRVLGENNSATLINNYAWDGTLVGGSQVSGVATDVNGDNLSYTSSTGLSTQFTTVFGGDSAWIYSTDGLPVLKIFGAEVQSSDLPSYIVATPPKNISSVGDLLTFAQWVNDGNDCDGETYTLTTDLDLSGVDWTAIGNSTNSDPFKGTFDGGGFAIKNLTLETSAGYIGLFGYIEGATIQNLGLEDCVITGTTVVGGLVGRSTTGSVISHCYVTGSLSAKNGFVGLLAATARETEIRNCYTVGAVSGSSTTGGLVGDANTTSISNCYSLVNVQGNNSGGLVGQHQSSTISNSYATGTVISFDETLGYGSQIGGIAGLGDPATGSSEKAVVENSVALNQTIWGGGTTVKRILGTGSSKTTLTDNYGWDGMTINGTKVTGGLADENGANLSYTDGALSTQFSAIFKDTTDAWTFTQNKLPILKNVGGKQTSDLPSYITDEKPSSTISTIADLQALAAWVNAGNDCMGDTYTLQNDLDLSLVASWTPIGNYTDDTIKNTFSGTFDGNGYVISNLTITGNGTELGLFGYTENASIQNLGLLDCSVSGDTAVAALAGVAIGGTITNCYATGVVTGTGDYIGGLVGANSSHMTNCYTTVNVTGGYYVGGLVGAIASATISKSYATGEVTGTGNSIGGLVGMIDNGSLLQQSVALNPSVSGDSETNRVAGNKSGTMANNYAWTGMLVDGSTVSGGALENVNGKDLSYDAGTLSQEFTTIFGGDSGWTYASNKLPILANFKGSQSSDLPNYMYSKPDGTIDSVADLQALAQWVNAGNNCDGDTYILTANLDLSGVVWTPIGNYVRYDDNNPFSGIFDGGGYVISNLSIASSSSYQGLFGYATNATIKNLGIEHCSVSGSSNVGGLVGGISASTVQNCYVTGIVSGSSSSVGGLVGDASGYSSSSTITNCYATASVSGGYNVGGLVGSLASDSITNCYATGSVSGDLQVGGLVGNGDMGTVQNSVALNPSVSGGSEWASGRVSGARGTFSNNHAWDGMLLNGSPVTGGTATDANGADLSYLTALSAQFEDIFDDTTGAWIFANNKLPILANFTEGSQSSALPSYMDIAPPTSIATVADLQALATWVNNGNDCDGETYTLQNDLDLSGVAWTPIGNISVTFQGTFDGGGHVISNLTTTSTKSYQGLFGKTVGATIQNLGIEDCHVTGVNYVGALAGYVSNSTIQNCYATGSVAGTNNLGGLVGSTASSYTDTSSIQNCYATVAVTGIGDKVGGLVGVGQSSTVQNCYATGAVSGTNNVGGLVGYSSSDTTIQNSVALNPTVSGSSDVNRVVGNSSATLSGNFAWKDMLVSEAKATDGTGSNPNGEDCFVVEGMFVKGDGSSLYEDTSIFPTSAWTIPSASKGDYMLLPTLIGVGDDVPSIYLVQTMGSEWTITFDVDGDITSVASQKTVENQLTTLPEPTKTDFVFEGWYLENTYTTKVTTSTVFLADSTIYAKWLQSPVAGDFDFAPSSSLVYDGTAKPATVKAKTSLSSALTGTVTVYYEGISPTVYGKTTTAPTNVGNYQVSIHVTAGGDYLAVTALTEASWTFEITKATYSASTNVSASAKYGQSGTADLSIWENVTGAYFGTVSVTDADRILDGTPSITGNILSFAMVNEESKTGKSATLTIPVSSTNYHDFDLVVTVTMSTSTPVSLVVTSGTQAYTEKETFDPTGLNVAVTYEDDTTQTIAYVGNEDKFTFDPTLETELSPHHTSITITYEGLSTRLPITVTPIYDLSGTVYDWDKTTAIEGATIALFQNGDQVGDSKTTSVEGKFSFEDVKEGIYNLVATYENRETMGTTVRTLLVVLDHHRETTIVMPKENVHSTVEIGDVDDVLAVGGVDEVADLLADSLGDSNPTEKIQVSLTVEAPEEEIQTAIKEKAEELGDGETVGLWLDVSIHKIIGDGGSEPLHNTSPTLLEIVFALPEAFQNKEGYAVYREHQGEIEKIYTTKNAEGEYLEVNSDKTLLTLYVCKFSAYGVAWADSLILNPDDTTTPNPSPSDPETEDEDSDGSDNSGSSGNTDSSGNTGSPSSSVTYPVLKPSSHGSVTIDPTRAENGKTVTITATPDEGYELDSISVVDANGNSITLRSNVDGTFSFTQPIAKVTIQVLFKEREGDPQDDFVEIFPEDLFYDVKTTDWFYSYVKFALEHELMAGMGNGRFGPEEQTLRGMIVTMLHSMAGKPTATNPQYFVDVVATDYYYEPCLWASQHGIVSGVGNQKFDPNTAVTREQICVILYKYALTQTDLEINSVPKASYVDGDTISDWSMEGVNWCSANGIVEGYENGKFNPSASAKRAEIATMLTNFVLLLEA